MGSVRRRISLVALVLVTVAVSSPRLTTAEDADTPFSTQGRAAVAALGDDLDDAAARYGMTGARLRQILVTDPAARIDRDGRLFYEDVFPAPPEQRVAARSSRELESFNSSRAFKLHSRPGAKRVIYLDFNGGRISGTIWNTKPGFRSTRKPFSLDGSDAFSTAERRIVHEVWLRVAEDYAPFAIDVTTEQPPASAIERTGRSDQIYGTVAMIGPENPLNGDTVCNGCAGIAYVGVFDEPDVHSYYQPAIVLSNKGNNDASQIAEITSHEVGHNLGLSHDGEGSFDYHGGSGNWGPIMGAPYTEITQWSDGSYSGATNTEDDLAVVADNGGVLAPDDHGGTIGTATNGGGYGPLDVDGVIGTGADVDAVRFTVSSSVDARIAVRPAEVGPDLDVRAVLRRVDGTPVTVDDSPGMGACLAASLTAGDYVVSVDGTRRGDPFGSPSNGYSDYGSTGRYTVVSEPCVPGPRLLSEWGESGTAAGQIFSFDALTVAPNGDVWVADGDSLHRFDPDGSFIESIVNPATATVVDIATASNGDIYVLQSDSRIRVVDESGTLLRTLGQAGSANGQTNGPSGIAISPIGGLVLVADAGNDRVMAYTAAGAYHSKFGSVGSNDGQFQNPAAIGVDAGGRAYVADTTASNTIRVQNFELSGASTWSFVWSSEMPGGDGFPPGISGVAVGSNDVVYVTDQNNDMLGALRTDGSGVTSWSEVTSAFWSVTGVATGPQGDLFLALGFSTRVQRWSDEPAEATPPTVSISDPAGAVKVRVGATLRLTYTCTDGGSGIESCRGPVASGESLDTFQPGRRLVTVVATDRDGNTARVTRSVTVVAPQPDMRVRRRGTTSWTGNDRYNFAPQTLNVGVRPNSSVVCQFSVQNDAAVSDRMMLRLAAVGGGYTITARSPSGAGITKAVKAGTYRTPLLQPGEQHTINVTVARNATTGQVARVDVAASSMFAEIGGDGAACLVLPLS